MNAPKPRGRKPKYQEQEPDIPEDIAEAISQWERTHNDELAKYFNRDSDE